MSTPSNASSADGAIDALIDAPSPSWMATLRPWLMPFASLQLTVILFAMAIVLIFVGTLAQTKMDMWEVMDAYFRVWFARVPFQVFLPPAWFPQWQDVPGGFIFPGGYAIGTALAINLVAAHGLRFRIQATGARLAAGLATILIGVGLTWFIVASGQNNEGEQGRPMVSWLQLWLGCKLALAVMAVTAAGATARFAADGRIRKVQFWIVAIPSILLGLFTVWVWSAGDRAYVGDAGMRILWQLIQGGLAGAVLCVGCVLVFRRRGSVVLLHGGVGLLMFSELLVGQYAVEGQMMIDEGKTSNYVMDIREVELAWIDRSGEDVDKVAVVPNDLLHPGTMISDAQLPVDIQVVQFMPNTHYEEVARRPGHISLPRVTDVTDFENPATIGVGKVLAAVPARKTSGTDTNRGVDIASAYITLLSKDDKKPLGTYLVSRLLRDQPITVDGKTYDVSLRFKRTYKPYTIRLDDVRKDDYVGTNTPRNYSSAIWLTDPRNNVDRSVHIWMNNPLRYAGETFYQSNYERDPSGLETTTFQVVTNGGWMIPYVACMLIAIGLLVHFSATLYRFLLSDLRTRTAPTTKPGLVGWLRGNWFPVGILVGAVLLAGWIGRPISDDGPEMRVQAFGRLPVAYHGRVKPMDSLARNALRAISERTTFKVPDKDGKEIRQPAIVWLLDVISRSDAGDDHEVFRIENMELLDTLGLKRRAGMRYAYREIEPQLKEFLRQVQLARKQDEGLLTIHQRKTLELNNKLELFHALQAAHGIAEEKLEAAVLANLISIGAEVANRSIPYAVPTGSEIRSWEPLATARVANQVRQYAKQHELKSSHALAKHLIDAMFSEKEYERLISQEIAHAIEPLVRSRHKALSDEEIRELAEQSVARMPATLRDGMAPAARKLIDRRRIDVELRLEGMVTVVNQGPSLDLPHNAFADSLAAILVAYREGDVTAFQAQLDDYQDLLTHDAPKELQPGTSFIGKAIDRLFGNACNFEAYINRIAPFDMAGGLYLIAFVLAALAWLGWSDPLNRAASWLILFTFGLHTLAIVARIYISGRPPVTNLYSSAIFIGWGAVLFGIIFEKLFRLGIGNIVAAVAGFATLRVAYGLAADGDTITVLQAVLDTQFWLATHVVCIALGYATTFVAGTLGALYILRGTLTRSLTPDIAKALTRMMYGTLCFAIFFSLVGTILGGLWADDSWGRFWGWDPKENGALIIVLWNALVLHARWGGMVKQRGLAVLLIGGNIVTAWSWFGVNELGVGLHSYGFTEGILLKLALFVGSQLLLICLGLMPRDWWLSSQTQSEPTTT